MSILPSYVMMSTNWFNKMNEYTTELCHDVYTWVIIMALKINKGFVQAVKCTFIFMDILIKYGSCDVAYTVQNMFFF